MATIVERAVGGHMKSMQELYEANKQELYTFCCYILRNAAKAAKASENVFSDVWARAKDQEISKEEDFRKLLLLCAARQCQKILFGKTPEVFRLSRVPVFTPQTVLSEEFTGDITKGTNTLFDTLDKLDAAKRFIFLACTIGNISDKKLSDVIGQRAEIVRYNFAAAVTVLKKELPSELSVSHVASLYRQSVEKAVCPESMDKNCTAIMESRAVSDLPPKKVLIGIGIGVVCLIGILIAIFASGNIEPTNSTDLSGNFSSGDLDNTYNEDDLASSIDTAELVIDTSFT